MEIILIHLFPSHEDACYELNSTASILSECVQLSGIETRPTHVIATAGTQVPPQTMEVRSSGLSSSRFQPTCMP